MILESQIEIQYLQMKEQGSIMGSATTVKCQIIDNMIYQRVLLNQAELDSIVVEDSDVENQLDQRIQYFIAQMGSQEKLEEYYQKSILEIKDEFRPLMKEQLIIQEVQSKITENVNVSPSEVRAFYKTIPYDSLPLINSQVEIAQIIKTPPISMEQKTIVKEKLRELHRRILNGESFAVLARLYSEDPGSASKGGELGFYGRGELYPEFEAVAFRLNEGEVSDIVETQAGFHIIQMIEKKGDYINVRHILLTAKVSPVDLANVKKELDSIAVLIREGTMTFEEAAEKFSDDPGKNSGGILINPSSGDTKFEMDELDPPISFVINNLEPGEFSNAVPYKTREGKDEYRLIKLLKRTEPHRANLEDDYFLIYNAALSQKKSEKELEWINKNIQHAYIFISDRYADCNFQFNWKKENN
jgi:peptidyl-prolyl cis-trans isomerase SurA